MLESELGIKYDAKPAKETIRIMLDGYCKAIDEDDEYLKNLYIRVRIALSDRGYVYSFPDAVSSENEEAGGRRNGIVWENERLVLNLFEPRITPDEFEE
jgi:hypothetical protein